MLLLGDFKTSIAEHGNIVGCEMPCADGVDSPTRLHNLVEMS